MEREIKLPIPKIEDIKALIEAEVEKRVPKVMFDAGTITTPAKGWYGVEFKTIFIVPPKVFPVVEVKAAKPKIKKYKAPEAKIALPPIDIEITPAEIDLPTDIGFELPTVRVGEVALKAMEEIPEITWEDVKGVVLEKVLFPALKHLGIKLPMITPWSVKYARPCDAKGYYIKRAYKIAKTQFLPGISLRASPTRRLFFGGYNRQRMQIRATIIIPQDNTEVKFFTRSDDGSMLWTNDPTVGRKWYAIVNNWGNHAPRTRSGVYTYKKAGSYVLRIDYFNGNGTGMLDFWTEPGIMPRFGEIDLDQFIEFAIYRTLEYAWDRMWDAVYAAMKNIPSSVFGYLRGYKVFPGFGYSKKILGKKVGFKIPAYYTPNFSGYVRNVMKKLAGYVKAGVGTSGIVVKPIFKMVGQLIGRSIAWIANSLYKSLTGWIGDQQDRIRASFHDLIGKVNTQIATMREVVEDKINAIKDGANTAITTLKNSSKEKLDSIRGYLNLNVVPFTKDVDTQLKRLRLEVQNAFAAVRDDLNTKINDAFSLSSERIADGVTIGFSAQRDNIREGLSNALDDFRGNLEKEMNDKLSKITNFAQDAVNSIVPDILDYNDLPEGYNMANVLIRNITNKGFEVWGSEGMKLHYLAVALP